MNHQLSRPLTIALLAAAPFVAASLPRPAGAVTPFLHRPCSIVTRADASTALGAAASPGFAVGSNRTNASLGAAVTGPKIECRYHARTGNVDVTVRSYSNAHAAFRHERSLWFPTVMLSGIGDEAFYIGGSGVYARKGNVIVFVSLNFKARVANPRVPYPELAQLAKIAVSRL